MEQSMRKISREMSIYMSFIMSFFLSLTGTLTSGHFTVPAFISSFLISTVISLIIGLLVPMGRIGQNVDRKMHLQPGSMKARCMESLISDLIYTPIMTLCMVTFAYFMAKKQSSGHADIPFVPMFLKSFAICMVVGYVLIFIFQPLLLKMLMKKYNVQMGPPPGMPGQNGGRPGQNDQRNSQNG